MTSEWKPNLKHDHVFVVLRADSLLTAKSTQAIAATKAFWTKEEARVEVDRLNQGAHEETEYSWVVARLPRE